MEDLSEIKKRQHFYFLGSKLAKGGNLLEAIQAFKKYSLVLSDKDKHLPHLWISKYYTELGEVENSIMHLELYALGCSDQVAADVFKECGDKYYNLDQKDKALNNYLLALSKNNNIGVKSRIQELES